MVINTYVVGFAAIGVVVLGIATSDLTEPELSNSLHT